MPQLPFTVATALSRYLGQRVLALAALGVGALLLVFFVEYRVSKAELTQTSLDRLAAVASTLALQVDGVDHEALLAATPRRDGFTAWETAPAEHRALHALFRTAELDNALGTPVYSLRLRPEKAAAVRAAPDRVHPDAMEFVITSAVEPYWRHTYQYKPEMAATLFEGRPVRLEPYDDEHGQWISAYAPIRAMGGGVVGLVSVDSRLDQLQRALEGRLASRFSIEAGVFGALFLVIGLGLRRTIRSIGAVESAAGRLGQGDYLTPIDAGRTGPVSMLARNLESARSEVEQRTRAEEEARARTRFMARMSHQIRTPMNGVLGLARLLRDAQLPGDQRRMVGDIESSARHLLDIVNRMLDLSKLGDEEVGLVEAPFDPRAVFDEVGDTIRPLVAERPVELVVAVDADVPAGLLGDATRVRQIVQNLADNAARFTDAGRIEARLSCASVADGRASLVVEVTDTGRGIEDPEALFDAFRQAHDPGVDAAAGVGLGLTITAELVRAMGGTIDVDSTPGEGSRFTVRLSLPVVAAPPDASLERAPLTGRVLVADDNPINRMVAARTVKKLGAEVESFDDGDTAWAALGDRDYDCLLLDLHMPRMNGLELVRRVRSRSGDEARVPILMVTAGVSPEERAACFAAGADGFIGKPFTLDELHGAIVACMRPFSAV